MCFVAGVSVRMRCLAWTVAIGASAICGCKEAPPPAAEASHGLRSGPRDSTVLGDHRPVRSIRKAAPEVTTLEDLIDGYTAVDVLVDALWRSTSKSSMADYAWRKDHGEEATIARLSALLAAEYRERYVPASPLDLPIDSLTRLPKAEARARLDAILAGHDRSVTTRINAALPHLTNETVKRTLRQLAVVEATEATNLSPP